MIQILLLSNLNSIIKFIITLIHSIIFKSFKFFSIISIFSFFFNFHIIYSKKRETKKKSRKRQEQLDDSSANNQFYDQSREYRKPTVEPRTLSSNEERGQMEVGIPAQRGADSS